MLRLLALAVVSAALLLARAHAAEPAAAFVRAQGTGFVLDGRPFFVTGINNHYLTYGSEAEVTRVLDDAVALGANVVRTFLQPVIGSPDGAVATVWDWKSGAETSNLGVNGHYMLFWDRARGRMGINAGANGLGKLDVLVAEAKKRNLRLLIALLDFWQYTGGAQQMRAWYGSGDHKAFFFADARTRADYRTWVRTVLERVNPLTGIAYKDEPTIFGWDLMNEPSAEPLSLRHAWIAEMAAYLKSIDRNHLLTSGQDNVANRLSDLAIPDLDFATWHGYPLYYGMTVRQFARTITDFCAMARRQGKPVLLEEFGYARSNPDQAQAYGLWLDTIHDDPDCAGWMIWRLVSRQDSGRYPVDEHDQFDIHNDGGPVWNTVKAAAAKPRAKPLSP